jgi:hypothetical protein
VSGHASAQKVNSTRMPTSQAPDSRRLRWIRMETATRDPSCSLSTISPQAGFQGNRHADGSTPEALARIAARDALRSPAPCRNPTLVRAFRSAWWHRRWHREPSDANKHFVDHRRDCAGFCAVCRWSVLAEPDWIQRWTGRPPHVSCARIPPSSKRGRSWAPQTPVPLEAGVV